MADTHSSQTALVQQRDQGLYISSAATTSASKPIWALVVVVVLWSLSPIALVVCSQLFPSEILASAAVLTAVVFLIVFFLIIDRSVLIEAWDLLTFQMSPSIGTSKAKSYFGLFALSFAGFLVYPWFYVQAMNGAAVAALSGTSSASDTIVVNIINYLWPCCAVAFSWLVFGDPVPSKRISGVILSFCGALLSVSAITGIRLRVLDWLYGTSFLPQQSVALRPTWFFLFAAIGALTWGFYTAYLPRIGFISVSGREVRVSAFYLVLLAISVPLHIAYLVTQWKLIIGFHYSFGMIKVMSFLLYSAGSLSAAHCLFTFVLRSKKLSIATTAATTYFVFAIGTLLLFALTTHALSLPIVAGFALIIIGVFLARDRQLISPVPGFITFFIIAHGLSAFFIPNGYTRNGTLAQYDELYIKFLEALTALFAIISAFTLAKSNTRYVESKRSFSSTMQLWSRLARASEGVSDLAPKLEKLLHLIRRAYVSSYVSRHGLSSESDEYEDINNELNEIERWVNSQRNGLEGSMEMSVSTHELRNRIAEWGASTIHGVTSYEWLVLISLVVIMTGIGYRVTVTEPLFQIGRAAFDAGLVIILFAIADFDQGRPNQALRFLHESSHWLPRQFRSVDRGLESVLAVSRWPEIVLVVAVAIFGILSYIVQG